MGDPLSLPSVARREIDFLRTRLDAARTALHHLAPWAEALLDAGLVRDADGWSRADGERVLLREPWRTGLQTMVWRVGTASVYATEETAARAWLAAREVSDG